MRIRSLARLAAPFVLLFSVAHADLSRRFYDFTPLSADNPVVATIDDNIKIPLSELRGYRDAEHLRTVNEDEPTPLPVKRNVLELLINEYLYIDEAYRSGVTQTPEFIKQMEATRTMLLTDFMSARASNEKAATSVPTSGDAGAELAEKLFEATPVVVSNEAYDVLKNAAKQIDTTSAASNLGPVIEDKQSAHAKLYAIVEKTPDVTLVEYENKKISTRQLLVIYAGLPAPRPAVQTQEGLIEMIKPLILPELMAIEAAKRGIADEPEFQNKLIQNKNVLLRFHMHGVIERQANQMLRAPNAEADMRAWFEKNKAQYTVTDDAGKKNIPSYEDQRAVVEGDYSVALRDQMMAEKAQALRNGRKITIDEDVLNRL